MAYQSEFNKDSRDPQSSGRAEKVISTQTSLCLKLQDRFRLDRPSLSYADFHHEIIKNADNLPPKFPGNHQNPGVVRKEAEDDELVKYMSNLPTYLARGENFQEKGLNVGVLDWGRLEKWQHNLKQIPSRSSVYSPSSSNTSSFFSNDGSSTNSSSGHSSSSSCQKIHRPTLQSHLKASPQEGSLQCSESFGGNAGNFQDLKITQTGMLNMQQKNSKTDKPSDKNQSEAKLDWSMKKDSDVKIIGKMGSVSHQENYEETSCSNGKMKTQSSKFAKKAEKSEKLKIDIGDQDCSGNQNRVVLLLPRDISQISSSGVTQPCGSMAVSGRRSTEARRRDSVDRSSFTEVHSREFYSEIPHSCPLPCEVENYDHVQIRQHSFMDAQTIESSSDAAAPPLSDKVFISPSRSRKVEEKSTRLPSDSTAFKAPQVSDQKISAVAAAKVRYPSPTRLFSMGMNRISRSFNSKEDPVVQKLSSTHDTIGPGKERNSTSASLDKPGTGKKNANEKSRSSPLRRLLEPLLKPKAADSQRSSEPVRKGSTPSERACQSSEGQLESSTPHSVKVKLDLRSCKSINVKDSFQIGKDRSPAVQALLQVATKNGLPLFTFAVDNNSGILAATMKKLDTSVKDDDYSCLYTFFTIREIKKKSWINQGGKDKGRDYIPNVIAQMKVSDYQLPNSTRLNSKDYFRMRESVLFTVNVRQENQQTSDFQPKDELAAIVMKIPNQITTSMVQGREQCDNYCKLSDIGSKDCPPEVRCFSNSGKDLHSQALVRNQDPRSTTVILPSGVHSLSSKGEPSSLVERWISGGACDCGGWDLGCKLRVLGDGNQLDKKLSSSTTCSTTDQFELFDQEGVQEKQPVFSLATFRDGIYSVVFNSSLSHLQAFSICIAVLDSRKPSGLSDSSDSRKLPGLLDSSDSLQGKTSEETISIDNDGTKAPNGIEAQIPVRYVSYPPPLSPAGRV